MLYLLTRTFADNIGGVDDAVVAEIAAGNLTFCGFGAVSVSRMRLQQKLYDLQRQQQ